MSPSWREIVLTLAAPDSELIEGVAPELGDRNVAEMGMPGSYFRMTAETADEAMRGLTYRLADYRLMQSLEAAGWTDIDLAIDEVTYVVARDPDGTIWAIGTAAADDDQRRVYVEGDMRQDGLAQRIAFVQPLETASPEILVAALARSGPETGHRD